MEFGHNDHRAYAVDGTPIRGTATVEVTADEAMAADDHGHGEESDVADPVELAMLARVPVFAHGVGARRDLPLALVISFVALGTLWTTPRLAKAAAGRQLTSPPLAGWLNVLRWVGRIAALALFMLALWAGLIGTNDTGNNPLPVTLYVVVWVGAQHAINPLVTLAEIVETLGGRSISSGQAASTPFASTPFAGSGGAGCLSVLRAGSSHRIDAAIVGVDAARPHIGVPRPRCPLGLRLAC
ncbi:MAG: hypothetical protein ACI8TP_001892 [Acidimicrobiales bacterium]